MDKIIVKFGGSVITDKKTKYFPTRLHTIEQDSHKYVLISNLKRLTKELAEAIAEKKSQIILVHGAGPFGHFLVNEYLNGNKKISPELVHDSMLILNKIVKKELRNNGIQTKVIHPFENCLYLGKKKYNCESIFERVKEVLEIGKIPVIYGDVVPTDKVKGRLKDFEVMSGDILASELAKMWKADKVIMVSDVDKIEKEFIDEAGDVTGSMKLKVTQLSKLKCPAIIVNGTKPNTLKQAILGKNVGITIKKK